MECFDCKKELKGGFGFGDKPFTKWRCAECVIEKVDKESMLHGFNMIHNECKSPFTHMRCNGYKDMYMEAMEKLRTISCMAEYFLEKEAR